MSLFHQLHYRDFKAYYLEYVLKPLRAEFPGLVSYPRFVELMPTALLPLSLYNVEDRKPVPRLAKKLWGKLCGDRGYLSQRLFAQLFEQGLPLITPSAIIGPIS